MDHSVWHVEVFFVLRISSAVGHEKELVIAEVQVADILSFLELSHFESVHRLFLRLVVEASQSELLLAARIDVRSNLLWVHLADGVEIVLSASAHQCRRRLRLG